MAENKNFKDLQRLNTLTMAKHQWKSSLLEMKKNTDELHRRRTQTNKKLNDFIQELFRQRIDFNSIDDDGVLERYRRYLKCRSNFDDDQNLRDEFDRLLNSIREYRRALPSIRLNESISSMSSILDFNENQIFSQSTSSSLIKPKALRLNNFRSELVAESTKSAPISFTMNYRFLPRTLTSKCEKFKRNSSSNLSSTRFSHEQFDHSEILQFFDELNASTTSSVRFTTVLDRLKFMKTTTKRSNFIENFSSTIDVDQQNEEEEEEIKQIQADLFNSPSLSSKVFFNIYSIVVNNPSQIAVYTMTISTIDLGSSFLVPYSVLSGHRPVLQRSTISNFKRVPCKRTNYTRQVTGIDPKTSNVEHLQENDIILKINNQTVAQWTREKIEQQFQRFTQLNVTCSITIVRLSHPFTRSSQ